MNKRSRESAEKQRLNIKKKLSGNIDISNRVQKFVDCRSKDVEKREIYIVEGDSALGSVKLSRDAEYPGHHARPGQDPKLPEGGLRPDLQERDHHGPASGCWAAAWRSRTSTCKDLAAFDLENLRWNKVVICTDADVDGFQIRTLILTMLYRL